MQVDAEAVVKSKVSETWQFSAQSPAGQEALSKKLLFGKYRISISEIGNIYLKDWSDMYREALH